MSKPVKAYAIREVTRTTKPLTPPSQRTAADFVTKFVVVDAADGSYESSLMDTREEAQAWADAVAARDAEDQAWAETMVKAGVEDVAS